MSSAGKGDTPRPLAVTPEEYRRRWERTFREVEEELERTKDWILPNKNDKPLGCQDTTTDNESCNGSRTGDTQCPQNVTPDPDINPAVWEEKRE